MAELNLSLSTVNANFAHTCGNVTSLVFQEFKNHFPKNFFVYEHVATELAVRQFKKSKKVEDFRKQKPSVAVQPRIVMDKTEANIDMYRRLYGTRVYDMLRPTYYDVKFLKDLDKNIYVDFGVDRQKMSFEFTVVLSTEFQQYNIASHMANQFRIEHPYYINDLDMVKIETVLPECVVNKISEDSGIPIIGADGTIKDFVNYLNKVSNIPITYQYQTSTGIYRFFMVITTNILMTYNSFSVSDSDKEGQISDYFPITIQLDIEFNYPNCFYYLNSSASQPIQQDPNSGLLSMDNTIDLFYTFQRTIIPERDSNNNDLYVSLAFTVENSDEDSIDISSLFTTDHKAIIDEMKTLNPQSPDSFINFILYKNGDIIPTTEYSVDWLTYNLKVKNTNDIYTYRLACYMDNRVLNEYSLKGYKY